MAREYVTDSLGYGVILLSHDWILRLVHLFCRDGEIAPNCVKTLTMPSFGELL